MIDVVVTQTGYAGETVSLDVEDEGRIVGSQEVKLPPDGEPAAVRVRFTASDAGPRRVPLPDRAAVRASSSPQNNARDALIDVADRREKILYYEGEPRPEMKFLRRAVARRQEPRGRDAAADRRQQVPARPRASTSPTSWSPASRRRARSCSPIAGLILGSVEAGAFTGDQLRMIAEFVERRGGGLLMLGGPRSFAEGGYAGTPVADVLPVTARAAARVADRFRSRALHVKPTRAGEAHGVTQIAADRGRLGRAVEGHAGPDERQHDSRR